MKNKILFEFFSTGIFSLLAGLLVGLAGLLLAGLGYLFFGMGTMVKLSVLFLFFESMTVAAFMQDYSLLKRIFCYFPFVIGVMTLVVVQPKPFPSFLLTLTGLSTFYVLGFLLGPKFRSWRFPNTAK